MTEVLENPEIKVAPPKPKALPYDDMPVNISVYNRAVTPIGNLIILVEALQTYVDQYVVPIWHTLCKLTVTNGPVAGTWGFVFLDDADEPGALAYHEDDGSPLAKVFVRTVLQNNEPLSVAASHELVEMLVDPTCDKTASDGAKLVAYETADPVEANTLVIDSFQMSDFVYPAYFDAATPIGTQLDQCNVLRQPFQIAEGGYQSIFENGQWSEVFGSLIKRQAFAREDRRGHRSEYRKYKAAKLRV